MAEQVGFAADIRPLFTDVDIDRACRNSDLSAYADVKANAPEILERLRGHGGSVMPPPPAKGGEGPWSRQSNLPAWVDGGCAPSSDAASTTKRAPRMPVKADKPFATIIAGAMLAGGVVLAASAVQAQPAGPPPGIFRHSGRFRLSRRQADARAVPAASGDLWPQRLHVSECLRPALAQPTPDGNHAIFETWYSEE